MNNYTKLIIDEKIKRNENKEEIAKFAHSLLRNFYIKTKEELQEIYTYLDVKWPDVYDNMDFGSLKHIDCSVDTMIWDLNESIIKPKYSFMIDKVYFQYLLKNARNSKEKTDLLIDYTNMLDRQYFPLKFYILDEIKIRRLGKMEEPLFIFKKDKDFKTNSIRDYWEYASKNREIDKNSYPKIKKWIFENLLLDESDATDTFMFLVEEFLTSLTFTEANTIKLRYSVYPNDLLYGQNYLIDKDVHQSVISLKRIENIINNEQSMNKTIEEINELYKKHKNEIEKNVHFAYKSIFKEFLYNGGEK